MNRALLKQVQQQPGPEAETPAAAGAPHFGNIGDVREYLLDLVRSTGQWFYDERYNFLLMGAGIILTIFLVVLINWFFKHVLINFIARRTPFELDEKILAKIRMPLLLVILISGCSISIQMLGMPGSAANWVPRVFFSVFLFAILWGVFRVIGTIDDHFREKRAALNPGLNDLVMVLVRKCIKVSAWIVATIFILQNIFHFNVAALITGAGVAGLAFAFAAQNTIANLFGAMSLISDKSFKVGDRIISGDAGGFVESVGFRSTRLRSLDGTVWEVPNRILADGTIENISQRRFIKQTFYLPLAFDTTPAKMREALAILKELLANRPVFDLEKYPPRYFFSDYKPNALEITVTLWINTMDFFEAMKMREEINLDILDRFAEAGIKLAYPGSINYIVNTNSNSNEGVSV